MCMSFPLGIRISAMPPSDTSAPAVTATHPLRNLTNVVINQKIVATFSEPMKADTLNAATFTLMAWGSSVAVPGTVTYNDITATFTPASVLAVNTRYVATITTGATSAYGVGLATNYAWSFTTGTLLDIWAPKIKGTNPVNGSTEVPRNLKIAITFSENMDADTITNNTLRVTWPDGSPVAGTVSYANKTANFTPAAPFAAFTLFTFSISGDAKDLAGNALSPRSFSFTTGASMDLVPPTITTTTPANAATNVCLNQIISLTFSEAIDVSSSPIKGKFTGPGGASVAGDVSYDTAKYIVTFVPSSNLLANTLYTVAIDKKMKDLAGNLLAPGAVPNPMSFTTGTNTCAVP